MIIYSHRGNLNGPSVTEENMPEKIDMCIDAGFHVEVDIYATSLGVYLGHDNPTYLIDYCWLNNRADKLLIHCKNVLTFSIMRENWLKGALTDNLQFFFNNDDHCSMTNGAELLIHPESRCLPKGSILILPEQSAFFNSQILENCFGVVTDYPYKWLEKTS